ncbi:MAG TPA: MFS transporter [Candidatus Limnocylindrales bacterium]
MTRSTRSARRWWALAAICLAVLAITLDVTVLTVALPSLAGALHASEVELQWFVTAYTLALVAGMLPAGLLGDRYGRRTVMLGAILLFAAGSIACALAPDPATFIAARVVLGLAGAAIVVMALATITVLFDEAERPRAVGIWGGANFIGLPLGPILGGWILSNGWWGWIFLMNVPVALIGALAVLALVPASRAPHAPRFDVPGIVLSSAGLVALMYGIVRAGVDGWDSAGALVAVALGMALLAAFGTWEWRLGARPGGEPLVDLSLFRSGSFTWGMILTALGAVGLFGILFALPQHLEAVMGDDPQGAGVRLLPVIGGLVVGAVPADRLAVRLGAKTTVAAGFAIVAAGLVAGSTLTVSSGDAFIAAWTFVSGVGAGIGFATAASAALVELPAERSGVGAALIQTVVKLGPAFGATILGSVLNAGYRARLDVAGLPAAAASAAQASVFGAVGIAHQLGAAGLLASARTSFVAGLDDALRVAAVIAVAGCLLGLAFLPARSSPVAAAGSARRAAPTM